MSARLALVGLLLSFCSGFYIGCESVKVKHVSDMGVVVDQGVFIPCNVDAGTSANAACPPDRPMCHPFASICVGCIPSSQTCQPGYECTEDYRCVPLDPSKPCKRNVDCPQRIDGANPLEIICNLDTGKCQQCATDSDCVALDGTSGLCIDTRCQQPD